MDKGISLKVSSSVSNEEIYEDPRLTKIWANIKSPYVFVPSVSSFAEKATRDYMEEMRFSINSQSEYQLLIEVSTFNITQVDKNKLECRVSLNYRLINGAGESVIPSRVASAHLEIDKKDDFGIALGRTYASALGEIRWETIAKYLKVAESPCEEKNKQVTGDGDTALEHSIIRWYIESAPQGADVTWRVISSTPDVTNTNSTFVGTTPYESTESFDIQGLTYNNSGNVQIEVTCERPGYIPQKKRFNLRQAIDQKEISAKFNLVKEEE